MIRILAVLATTISAHAALAQPVAPALFGSLPSVSEVRISPDGRTLAMLSSSARGGAVVLYDISGNNAKPLGFGLGDAKGRGIQWADNNSLMLLASRAYNLSTTDGLQRTEMWRWIAVAVPEMKSEMLFGNEPGFYNSDSGWLLAITAEESARAIFLIRGNLYAVNPRSGKEKLIATGNDQTTDWIVDRSGAAVARVDYNRGKRAREIWLVDGSVNNMRRGANFEDGPDDDVSIEFYGMTDKPGVAYASKREPDGSRAFVEVDLTSGAVLSTLREDAGNAMLMDYHQGRAVGMTEIGDLPRNIYFDPERQKIQDSLSRALPKAAVLMESQSTDGLKFVVRAKFVDHPDQFFLYDKPAKSMKMVAASYEDLDGKIFARKEKFDYTAPDGLLIPGYLTVPKGAVKTNMPLIVLPHGGPSARDDMSFDWWAFFYAARGYLVYQPNFRGSDGYGTAFERAGDGEWGRKMQDDITNGVRKLVADGVVDPKRICIVGASYGGYAALAGGTLTPELYACVVSIGAVANLPGFLGGAAREGTSEQYLAARIGSRFRDEKELIAVSPVHNAARATAPFLLIHGRDDTVVPPGQSRQMRDALLAAKKEVEWVELAGEDHWFSRSATRTEMLARSIAFIDKHIGASK